MGNPFGFGSFVSKQFGEANQISAGYGAVVGQQKQLFSNVKINFFIPKDSSILGESDFNLGEILEDEIDNFEKLEYFVSFAKDE